MELFDFLKENNLLEEKEAQFLDKTMKVYILRLNKNTFDKDLVFTAAYYVIDDDNAIFIDEEENFWKVYLFLENKKRLFTFLNQIINYFYYRERSKEDQELKKFLINLFLYGEKE